MEDAIARRGRVLVAAVLGVITYLTVWGPELVADRFVWLALLDAGVGSAGLVVARRLDRRPVVCAWVLNAAATVSVSAFGAAFVSLVYLVSRRVWDHVAALVVWSFASAYTLDLLLPATARLGQSKVALVGLVVWAFTLVCGLYVGARRSLMEAWRLRLEEADEHARAEAVAAATAERTRIARDMHDVLAHRITQIAVHAGYLQSAPQAPQERRTESVDLIADTARRALAELREVLGLLRDAGTGLAGARRVPTIEDIERLAEEARLLGQPVTLSVTEGCRLSGRVADPVYRVLAEGLTNAHRHARGAAVTACVRLTRAAVEVVVRNGPGEVVAEMSEAGSGLGLVGVRERVQSLGGAVRYGATPDGGFELRACIPAVGHDSPTPEGR